MPVTPHPRLHRRKWVAAKVEAVKGTPEALTDAEAKLLVFDPSLEQDIEQEARTPAGLSMGRLSAINGPYAGRFRARVEVRGKGGGLPYWASTLLLGCGFKATGALLEPVSSIEDQKTLTIAVWDDGVKKMLTGAMGSVNLTGEHGRRVFAEFDFRGVWVAPVDAANPAPIHEATAPPRFANSIFQIGALHPNISRWAMDLGNDVQLRADVESNAAILHAYIADRNPTWRFDPEAFKVADNDLYGQFLAGTEFAATLTINNVVGNKITFEVPKLQYSQTTTTNRNGLTVHDLVAGANATAGDDELTIEFE